MAYELWVNPARPGAYEITHYRVSIPPSDGPQPLEILIWNAHPNPPLLCFERVKQVGRPQLFVWRSVPHGTPRYETEMRHAIEVYGLRRQELGLKPLL